MSIIDIENFFDSEKLEEVYSERVRNKAGKGIDGIDSIKFDISLKETLLTISQKTTNEKYRFTPYLEIIKSKGKGKAPRVISKPTIRDKITLSTLKDILHKSFPDSIPNKLPNTYVFEIKNTIEEHKLKNLHYLKVDIKGFYDNIDHNILLRILENSMSDKRIITLIRRGIKNKTVPRSYKRDDFKESQNTVGVPQGLSISNILANLYMQDFDNSISSLGLRYFRYVDDVLIFCKANEIKEIEDKVNSSLKEIGLETNEKTEDGSITKPFEYLGYELSSKEITVRKSTVDRFISSIISMFTDFKHNAEYRVKKSKWMKEEHVKDLFILNLNERITGAISDNRRYGWLFYFIEIDDMHLLHKIDSIIESQFSRLKLFNHKVPNELKSLVKAYYCAKYDTFGGYIHNYGEYKTVADTIRFLVKFGYIAEYDSKSYSEDDIIRKFHKAKSSHIVKLEEDIGNIS